MGRRALVTGIHGFGGRHLALHLAQQGYAVSGLDLARGEQFPGIEVHTGDIRQPAFVQQVIDRVRPTHIFHLAALIKPDAEMQVLYNVNATGTQLLLEAVRLAHLDPAILITGSSAVYGLVKSEDLPIRESQPFRPLNGYAVSKIAQEMLAFTYYAKHGLRVIRTRAFNLTGPGEPRSLVCAALAEQIARIEAGKDQPRLRIGNLTPKRDFLDIRDAARAYRLAAEMGQPGEVYNVCSGQTIPIQTCLDELLGLSPISPEVEQEPARMRPADIPVSVGDASLLCRQTGWRPVIPLRTSLSDLLDDWRRRIRETRL
jgi:GDP-4-dehydro-6-deoxy-D-mannose reductase